MVKVFVAGAILLTSASAWGNVPVPPFIGLDKAVGRAATIRNAIAIHDMVSGQVSGPSLQASPAFTQGPARAEDIRGSVAAVHPFWIWLLRIGTTAGAFLIAGLCCSGDRMKRYLSLLTVAVAIVALLDAGVNTANEWTTKSGTSVRLARAEWQWRLDLARASAQPDATAGTTALDAAQRYAVSVARR